LKIGEDPFLPGITDHVRQESGDSGLSAPDYMSTIDDSMDGVNANGKLFSNHL
jgi:transcriptional coactivator YAP1